MKSEANERNQSSGPSKIPAHGLARARYSGIIVHLSPNGRIELQFPGLARPRSNPLRLLRNQTGQRISSSGAIGARVARASILAADSQSPDVQLRKVAFIRVECDSRAFQIGRRSDLGLPRLPAASANPRIVEYTEPARRGSVYSDRAESNRAESTRDEQPESRRRDMRPIRVHVFA